MTIIQILPYIAVILIGAALGIGIFAAVQRATARSRAKTIVEDAEREAEVIMKDKLLEAREQELRIKNEAEKAANQRLQRVQSEESKIKQRQNQLNQQQSENARTRNENEQIRKELEAQNVALEQRSEELEKMIRSARETLEHISGLSSEEAKEKLIESLKDEAKTSAAAYIHDIMDEAKMTANKEAKRIVVQS
ncbi:MAG: Rnase Y domain-containing protein, partial [Duncaniella sp.]|nr:Rnase Y domain-containing protein [Duncaniella sp.]